MNNVERLVDYYDRIMSYKELEALNEKGPTPSQLKDHEVSMLEWYQAVNLAMIRKLKEVKPQKGGRFAENSRQINGE